MAIEELHKIMYLLKIDVDKTITFQVHMNHSIQSCYEIAKPNEQHLFDLLCMPFDVFDVNTCKCILIGDDIASR